MACSFHQLYVVCTFDRHCNDGAGCWAILIQESEFRILLYSTRKQVFDTSTATGKKERLVSLVGSLSSNTHPLTRKQ